MYYCYTSSRCSKEGLDNCMDLIRKKDILSSLSFLSSLPSSQSSCALNFISSLMDIPAFVSPFILPKKSVVPLMLKIKRARCHKSNGFVNSFTLQQKRLKSLCPWLDFFYAPDKDGVDHRLSLIKACDHSWLKTKPILKQVI